MIIHCEARAWWLVHGMLEKSIEAYYARRQVLYKGCAAQEHTVNAKSWNGSSKFSSSINSFKRVGWRQGQPNSLRFWGEQYKLQILNCHWQEAVKPRPTTQDYKLLIDPFLWPCSLLEDKKKEVKITLEMRNSGNRRLKEPWCLLERRVNRHSWKSLIA